MIFIITFPIWLGASFDQTDGILGELAGGFNKLQNLVHGGLRKYKIVSKNL
jgi:hypothetical protein